MADSWSNPNHSMSSPPRKEPTFTKVGKFAAGAKKTNTSFSPDAKPSEAVTAVEVGLNFDPLPVFTNPHASQAMMARSQLGLSGKTGSKMKQMKKGVRPHSAGDEEDMV